MIAAGRRTAPVPAFLVVLVMALGAALLALALSSCVVVPMQISPSSPHSTTYLRIHVDTLFTTAQFDALKVAVRNLEQDTKGRLKIQIVGMIDFSGPDLAAVEIAQEWMVLRAPDGGEIVTNLDKMLDGRILGACVPSDQYHITEGGGAVYVVTERVWSQAALVHVFAHELLHAAGVDHVADRASIMSLTACGHFTECPTEDGRPPVHMSTSDFMAFCRVNGCTTAPVDSTVPSATKGE